MATQLIAANSHSGSAFFHYAAVPSITQPPSKRNLLRRLSPATEAEDISDKLLDTCGYVSGNPSSVLLCTRGACGWDAENTNVVACGSNAFTCCAEHASQAINTCMDVDPSRSLSCDNTNFPYCGTMIYTDIYATGLVCVSDTNIRHQDIALQPTAATETSPSISTATSASTRSEDVNVSAAAGGAAGGAVFLIAALGILSFFSIRKVRRKRESQPNERIQQCTEADGRPITPSVPPYSSTSVQGKDAGGQPIEVEGKSQTHELDVEIAGDPTLTKTHLPQEHSVKGPTEVEGKPHAQELSASMAGPQEPWWGRVEMP